MGGGGAVTVTGFEDEEPQAEAHATSAHSKLGDGRSFMVPLREGSRDISSVSPLIQDTYCNPNLRRRQGNRLTL